MAFQARHRWIIQKIDQGFGIHNEALVEEAMRGEGVMDKVNSFFRADGPTKLFFFYQTPAVENEDGEFVPSEEEPAQLFVTDGEGQAMNNKSMYFLRTRGAGDLDPSKSNDGLVGYGMVDESPLRSLEAALANVYRPFLESSQNWGQASENETVEFMCGLDGFVSNLQESLKSLQAGLELRKPDKQYDVDTRNFSKISSNPAAVAHFIELLEEWCGSTEGYLEESDAGLNWESAEAGPDTELEYWRRRMQRLTSITEQLKTKECKMVIGVLTAITKQQQDVVPGLDRQELFALLRRWKQIDINITEAANEAKDNVKYLATLERFIEPLYNDTPSAILDTLPALLNSIKMIHTIARYYNTTERMTKLFMKITNQMIANCKRCINGSEPPEAIWDSHPEELLPVLESCLRLNEGYQEQYRLTKDKLLTMPKGKQFDFSETQIFGKFDLFCRRVIKLIDMFSTIHQFKSLANHSLEGMDTLIAAFFDVMNEFKGKKHDLLDYHNNKFDRDYVEFNVRISDLESSLQHFINQSFESITSIEASLNLLKQFQAILQRENLRSDLDSKFTVIFHNYGLDLHAVQELYEKQRHNPPAPRNMPPVAGNITWSRHLLQRIEEPMRKFESSPRVLATKDSKKIIKAYNKVARTLVAFEYLWYQAWCKSIETAKAGLQATLIIRHPVSRLLYVNFDQEILQLIREAKCLDRMGIEVPDGAKMVLLQEDKFKSYYNELSYALHENDRVMNKIVPVTALLLAPHVNDLEAKLRPGMVTLTWTSMNIDAYKQHFHQGLQRLEELINNINDIVESRIEKNLKVLTRTLLVDLPTNEAFALDEFVSLQERHVKKMSAVQMGKNVEVENAVEDLVTIVTSFPLEDGIDGVSKSEVVRVRTHYNQLMYQAILNCTRNSLEKVKKRVCNKGATGFLFVERPFFEVDVQLAVPSVRLSPSLDDVQRAINRSAYAVLHSCTSMYEWGQQAVDEEDKTSFFGRLGSDVAIVKVVLLLTGAVHGTKQQVKDYLLRFKVYDWLWKEDMELAYSRFMQRDPSIEDFELELRKFMEVEAEIERIAPMHNIGALSLNTKNLKLQLRNECRQWKVQYSDKVHQQARHAMEDLTEYMRTTNKKLGREVVDLDSLRYVMTVLREVRERESSIEMEINPILDMYQMLESYLPGGCMDKDEMDQKSVVRSNWRRLVNYAEAVTDNLSIIQGKFKKGLLQDVRDFTKDVALFRKDFQENGPMVPGITPTDAVERLRRFKDEFLMRQRKQEVYAAGEALFALRQTTHPEMAKTKKELGLLDQLYGLYMDVVNKMEEYSSVYWRDVEQHIDSMNEAVNGFDLRCKRMPKKLTEWQAYKDLKQMIADFTDMLPMLDALCRPAVRPRHWNEVASITGTTFEVDGELFKLKSILDSDLVEYKEDIEELCEGANKQQQIETKLREVKEKWDTCSFDFIMWKTRDVPTLKGFGLIIEELEDAQMQLQGMLSMRHVVPFKAEAQAKLSQLSDTADTLERWIKVQMLWSSLEAVFTGGDIAKQLPLEAKKFTKVDKDWLKIMTKAEDTRLVVTCCANELLRNTLPILLAELERCQKSLDGYLEQKRNKFPRFYFVSNPVLLQVLSKGSDPQSVQIYYEKIFDSIDRVVHDKKDKRQILIMKSIVGQDEEVIPLSKPVMAQGNIEDWLGALELEMQNTLKILCAQVAVDCMGMPLRQFVDSYCAQYALLGIQISWTFECQNALEKCRATKGIMAEKNKACLGVLSELSSWCLTDLKTKMNRTKVETLVTIQVHQRDVFNDMCLLFKDRKIQDPNDFEWLKQARFYWKPEVKDRLGDAACVISVCDVDFKYNYEYLGCKERLVITPLTDRCYITLSQALGMFFGGAPAGPAGTGKTETVKDLGRTLGIFVVVTNCTDQQRYTDMAKIFKGLCQAGLWGCFDEFNRIELPVLSVVAQQVLAVTNAKRTNAPSFTFPGDPQLIRLNPVCGYFITMNPGYAGRQELPENLKALFRGVAMMVPDREIIMKVKLCSVGYTHFTDLARKFATLYRLCEEQLSKQKHYDFGLRNILSVLRTAGKTKRDNVTADEELLVMSTLRDMNLSKLVAEDTPLFLSLLKDLFPNVKSASTASDQTIMNAVKRSISARNLIQHPSWIMKIIQLYETTLVRHGIMLVGPPGAGKTQITFVLTDALSETNGMQYKISRMNPKAIRAEDMFGETDKLSGEWLDGVFAAMWSKFNDRTRKDFTWLTCDGPVDAVWIENLNTVLDDNKILTLANGDRIPMTDNVKAMFEVEDLRNASPATVSRAGIIYVSASDLDWGPVVESWLTGRPATQIAPLKEFFKKYVGENTEKEIGHIFRFLRKECVEVLISTRVGVVEASLKLLTALLGSAELSISEADLSGELERLFLFSISWSIGGLLSPDDRTKFDEYLRNINEENMPPVVTSSTESSTIYDCCVNMETMEWERWNVPLWTYPAEGEGGSINFSNMLVPTVDSTRAIYLMEQMHAQRAPVLMVGEAGTAKTTTALLFFNTFPQDMLLKKINFSSATTCGMFQGTIEGELDKRGGKNFGPPAGKKMTIFLDDLSLPEVNTWGDQPTLEIVRQLVATGGICFLDKDKRGDVKVIEDLQYIGAMNPPGGGKNDIANRLKRQFFIFNMILPSAASVEDIYGQMLRGRFPESKYKKVFLDTIGKLTGATIKLWLWVKKSLLPTPAKFHYIFNMRELSRVFNGIVRTPRDNLPNEKVLLKLWRHENERVFSDKLTTDADKKKFAKELDANTESTFGKQSAKDKNDGGTIFVDFLRDDEYDEDGVLAREAPKEYELGGTLEFIRKRVQQFALQYNEEIPAMKVDLVLFDDALLHLTRLARVLGTPRGSMLLVGVGGSGKQSLTRLASFIARNFTFQIALTKAYNIGSLLDDLRALYKMAGCQNKQVTFIFTDAEIKDENFLEFLNSILATGEVTNLFPKDELMIMAGELGPDARKEPGFVETTDNLVKYFINRVRDNLHMVLCMSPVNAKFPERARKFPALISGSTIDWYLPWPEEALASVSRQFLSEFPIVCEPTAKEQLILHTGAVHQMATDVCQEYFQKMRRYAYQTPKSFLSFLESYKKLYSMKIDEINLKEKNVNLGLKKLVQGAEDVEKMKIVLAADEVKLRQAEEDSNVMLSKLQVSSMEAKKESDSVAVIKAACEKDAAAIGEEKKLAEIDLAKAQPYLDEAERAVQSIKPNDLNELKKLAKPTDIIKLIFDCVCILRMQVLAKVEKCSITLGIGKEKKTFDFILDSFPLAKGGMLADSRFLQLLFYFSKHEKDNINEETIEFMMPYLELEGFLPEVAKNASKAAEGLCCWVRAMTFYHNASKIVKPKLEALALAQGRLEVAQAQLDAAEARMQKCQDKLNGLQKDFEDQMASKAQIEANAQATKNKMEQATALIDGLGGEQIRWTEDSFKFAATKTKLIGDCAAACAFVSYCGPFDQSFRNYLVKEKFISDLVTRGIPMSDSIKTDMVSFIVDQGTIGDWTMQGLPTDPLSTENGILVTNSSRFPLLIDPQGQALRWIRRREEANMPPYGLTTLSHPKLKDQLEYAMSEGKAFIIAGVTEDIDPMLNPVLEKQIIRKAKSAYINVSDKLCEYNDEFMLYMTTRLPNPHFSPELQARTTVVNFTVTLKGLEEQLLGRVIKKEQAALEEQLTAVMTAVTSNTKSLLRLDAMLLQRLTENTGNLLDDLELIAVLADTKAKAKEVNEKLKSADQTKISINEKREVFRPVATRGSVLYFALVDLSLVNCMYQTSLDQFLDRFEGSMDVAEKASLLTQRVNNIIETMTYMLYRYVNRGIYEADKLSFILMVLLKIFVTEELLSAANISGFLKAGAALDITTAPKKPVPWMSDTAWLNCVALSAECPMFRALKDQVVRNEKMWRAWYEENEPENVAIPDYETELSGNIDTGGFWRMVLVRSLREDRTTLAVTQFIRTTETVPFEKTRIGAVGPRFVEPVTDTTESIFAEMTFMTPVVYLLSAGADPTDAIEVLSRKKRQTVQCVSMGEGQEPVALKAINTAMVNGSWVLLQNCHLGLEFMEGMEDLLAKIKDNCNPEFRLFITADPTPAFPIGLLQLAIKVTNEPPAGLRAGVLRSYTVMVDQEKLDRIETAQWRALVFTICFMHSVVQERRKFGALGWCIPYEFNNGDLTASLGFLEKHLYSGQLSWPTLQYMVAEAQYGGKITDNVDRRLFNMYAEAWLGPATLAPSFRFNPDTPVAKIPNDFVYNIPQLHDVNEYKAFIEGFPEIDSPEMIGLHPNADLTFMFKAANSLLTTITNTQPKQSAAAGGETREDVVTRKAAENLTKLPDDYIADDYKERIQKMGGLEVPLNIFLFQEIERLQGVIGRVRRVLTVLQQAIRGEVVMTTELQETLDAMYDARVPFSWLFNVGGDEISWLSPTLGLWFTTLTFRDSQARSWLNNQARPNSFWMTGFFNPQVSILVSSHRIICRHVSRSYLLPPFVSGVPHFDATRSNEAAQGRQVGSR
jgi:dynein heavy chain